jgi:guanylate kinase
MALNEFRLQYHYISNEEFFLLLNYTSKSEFVECNEMTRSRSGFVGSNIKLNYVCGTDQLLEFEL